jgi:hypothetical protein
VKTSFFSADSFIITGGRSRMRAIDFFNDPKRMSENLESWAAGKLLQMVKNLSWIFE